MDLEVLPEKRRDKIGRLTQSFSWIVASLRIAMMNQSDI
jgi:HAMP domain-containing protein